MAETSMTVTEMLAGRAAADADIRADILGVKAKLQAAKDAGFFPDGFSPFLSHVEMNVNSLAAIAPQLPYPTAE